LLAIIKEIMDMSVEDNIGFLLELIDSYRRIIKRPLDMEDYYFKTSSDLRAPLQISLIWFKSEKNDLQLFLTNHNNDFSDKSIDIYGPYNISVKSDFQNFEDSLNKEKLFNYIGDIENETTLRKKVIRMIRNNSKVLKNEPTNEIYSSGVFYKDCYYFFHNGDIFKRSIDEIIEFYQKEKERNEKLTEITKKLPLKPEMAPFFAGYINPPIWIGEKPSLTMEEQVKGKRLIEFVKTIYVGEILDRKIIVINDGCLGISMMCRIDEFPEEKEIVRIIKILNFLFSVFLIMGIRVKTVQASNFFSTTYLPEKDFLTIPHRKYSKSKEMFDKRHGIIDLESFKNFRIIVSLDKLTKSIDLAKNLINDQKLFNSLLLLIHSYSNLLNGEVNQSFILSWTIIEQHLNYKWDIFLNEKNVSRKRHKNLESGNFTAFIKADMLNFFGYISEKDFHIINGLRDKRNGFMHNIIPITNN